MIIVLVLLGIGEVLLALSLLALVMALRTHRHPVNLKARYSDRTGGPQ